MIQRLSQLTLLLCLALLSATALGASNPQNRYTVQPNTLSQTLYFAGSISPLVSTPVISPTQGVVQNIYFTYGQMIQKGQPLFLINAQKIASDLRDAKAAYLDALQTYNKKKHWQTDNDVLNAQDALNRSARALSEAKSTYLENQKLYQMEIISQDDLTQSKNAYQDSAASYAQAERSFQDLLAQSRGDDLMIAQLRLQNAKAKYCSLLKQRKQTRITAPATGVILQPEHLENTSSSGDNSSSDAPLQVGSTINYQQVLLTLGDLSGLRIDFDVPEVNINKLRIGQHTTITGVGFPNITLIGTVTSVGAQATTDTDSSVPTFPVEVTVPTLTQAQQAAIRSGMDAQVAVTVNTELHTLTVPISAVHQNASGQSIVQRYDPKTHQITPIVIQTGVVGVKTVQVRSGLMAGDQIVLPSNIP